MRAGHVVDYSLEVSMLIGRSGRPRVFFFGQSGRPVVCSYDRAAVPSQVPPTRAGPVLGSYDGRLLIINCSSLFSLAASAYAAAVYFVPTEWHVRHARRPESLVGATHIKH